MKRVIYINICILIFAVAVMTVIVMLFISLSGHFAAKALIAAAALMMAAGIAIYASECINSAVMKPINEIDLDNPDASNKYNELKPLILKIKTSNELKTENEKIRREFSANVSHELKTPLTSILGYAQMINNGMARQEDIPAFTNKIEKEAERLLLLINDIIELSNLDERGIVSEEEIYLADAVNENVAMLKNAADKRNVTISCRLEETKIMGSRTMINELVYNIVDNAIKYNKDGGSVTVSVKTVNDGVELSIKDTGIGIPEQDKERIFERFYRVDKSHSKIAGGTGLGLSIVKHIALCHNAELSLESKLGAGTEITVKFPEIVM